MPENSHLETDDDKRLAVYPPAGESYCENRYLVTSQVRKANSYIEMASVNGIGLAMPGEVSCAS